jgi:hypothetical protein
VRLSVDNAPSGRRSIDEIAEEIAAVRQQLYKSSGGLDYLISAIDSLEREARTTGQLTETSELFLRA